MGAKGSCQSERGRFTAATAAASKVTRCACSICTRLGALRAYQRPEAVGVAAARVERVIARTSIGSQVALA